MDVIVAGLLGMAAQLVASVLVWWLRLRWQLRVERLRGRATIQLAGRVARTGGWLRDQRADGSVTELMVRRNDGR